MSAEAGEVTMGSASSPAFGKQAMELKSVRERRDRSGAEGDGGWGVADGWLPQELQSLEAHASLTWALFEDSPNMLLLLSADGHIVGANAQALREYGYRREGLEGQPLDLLLSEAARECLAEPLAVPSQHGSVDRPCSDQSLHKRSSPDGSSSAGGWFRRSPVPSVGICTNLLTRDAVGDEFEVSVTFRPVVLGGTPYVVAICHHRDSQAAGEAVAEKQSGQTATQLAAELELRVVERTSQLNSTVEELKSKNEEIEALVAIVTHDLSEKEVLLREVYHRVKNNLQVVQSLLKMGSRTVPSDDARLAIDTAVQRVHVMAMVHEHLYQMPDLAALTLGSYLRDVVEGAIASNSEKPERIRLQLDTDEIPVPLDFAIPLGLLANELVSNCLKHGLAHGRAGKISISARKIPGSMRLVVHDDGVGLPEDFDASRTTSMGLKLASSLARQLGGQLSFSSANGCRVETDLARLHVAAEAGVAMAQQLNIPMHAAALNQRRKSASARSLQKEFSDPSRFLA